MAETKLDNPFVKLSNQRTTSRSAITPLTSPHTTIRKSSSHVKSEDGFEVFAPPSPTISESPPPSEIDPAKLFSNAGSGSGPCPVTQSPHVLAPGLVTPPKNLRKGTTGLSTEVTKKRRIIVLKRKPAEELSKTPVPSRRIVILKRKTSDDILKMGTTTETTSPLVPKRRIIVLKRKPAQALTGTNTSDNTVGPWNPEKHPVMVKSEFLDVFTPLDNLPSVEEESTNLPKSDNFLSTAVKRKRLESCLSGEDGTASRMGIVTASPSPTPPTKRRHIVTLKLSYGNLDPAIAATVAGQPSDEKIIAE